MCIPRALFCIALMIGANGCASTSEDRWRTFNDDGVQLFAKADYHAALDSFDYALTLHPQDPILTYNIAQCYDRLGDARRAEELYAYCLQRDAKHGDARLALISLMYRTNRVDAANQLIQDWLKQNPPSADAFVADAWRLRQEKAYPLAQRRSQQALSLEPSNRRALTEMAILLELQGMPDRSLALYGEILRREPNQLEIAERLQQLKAKGIKGPSPN